MDDHEMGTMSQFEAEAHSFIVRLWREGRAGDLKTFGWRGRVEHVQSGRHQYFSRLDELPGILHEQTGRLNQLDDVFETRRTDQGET